MKDSTFSKLFETLNDKLSGTTVCLYLTNNVKVIGIVYQMIDYGMLLQDPVIMTFHTQVTKFGSHRLINFTPLFDGITNQSINLIPSASVITFVPVIDYIATAHKNFINELKETKEEFLTTTETIDTPSGTIH